MVYLSNFIHTYRNSYIHIGQFVLPLTTNDFVIGRQQTLAFRPIVFENILKNFKLLINKGDSNPNPNPNPNPNASPNPNPNANPNRQLLINKGGYCTYVVFILV